MSNDPDATVQRITHLRNTEILARAELNRIAVATIPDVVRLVQKADWRVERVHLTRLKRALKKFNIHTGQWNHRHGE